jgi:predicted lipase
MLNKSINPKVSAFFSAVMSKLAYLDDGVFMYMIKFVFDKSEIKNFLKGNKDGKLDLNRTESVENIVNIAKKFNEIIIYLTNKKDLINSKKILWKTRKKFNKKFIKSNKLLKDINVNIKTPFILLRSSRDMNVYIIYNIEQNSIIVTFRGTNSFLSIKHDVNLTKKRKEDDIKFHKGFYKNIEGLVNRIINSMIYIYSKNKKELKPPKVIICGHSLGGALATLFSYYYIKWYDNWVKKLDTKIFKKKIYVITWGTPRVGNKKFVSVYNKLIELKQIEMLRCVVQNDPIVSLPLRIMGFYHVGKKYKVASTMKYNKNIKKLIINYKKNPMLLSKKISINIRRLGIPHLNALYIYFTGSELKKEWNNSRIEDGKSNFYGCKKKLINEEGILTDKECPVLYVKYYDADLNGGVGIGPFSYLKDNWDKVKKIENKKKMFKSSIKVNKTLLIIIVLVIIVISFIIFIFSKKNE